MNQSNSRSNHVRSVIPSRISYITQASGRASSKFSDVVDVTRTSEATRKKSGFAVVRNRLLARLSDIVTALLTTENTANKVVKQSNSLHHHSVIRSLQ